MAKHIVNPLRALDPKQRSGKTLSYWGSKLATVAKTIKLRKTVALAIGYPSDSDIGIAMAAVLQAAEVKGLRLNEQSMDGYIRRASQFTKPFAFAQLSLMLHGYLTYPPQATNPDECLTIWLQNLFNALGLLAVVFGYEPIADCLEPYCRDAS